MKLPLSWLARHVDLPDEPAADLAERFSLHGLEVDEVVRPGDGVSGVTTARVLSWAAHPNADTLRVVHVTHGDDDVELVCGAANFEVGDVVVHADVGATIPGMTLAAREVRGIVSNGMLCSARELEVGEDATGIMVLPRDTAVGIDVHELLPLGEPVFDLEVKGIRGDVLSVVGAARDIAAIVDTDVDEPTPPVPTRSAQAVSDPVDVRIDAGDACQHFVALTLDDVRVPAASPWWLQLRLAQCGLRAISPLVDITNLVMLELGQPMHAYDADRLDGGLAVRWADDGEHLVTLDDVARDLSTRDLVVADESGAIGLAGVMGGETTEVRDHTTRLVFEAAVWDPATVRHTARTLRLTSEASLRFERGVDPAGARRAVARAWELLLEVGGTATVVGVREAGEPVEARDPVEVSGAGINALLGLDMEASSMAEVLRRADIDVAVEGDTLRVIAPSWRRDLGRMADVAEEVARLHGYDQIPAVLPPIVQAGGLTADQRAERDVHAVATAFGCHEAITRPFVGSDALEGVLPGGAQVVLANPLAQDAAAMRTSMVEGLLQVVRRNVGQSQPGSAVYEFGRVFRPAGGPVDAALDAVTPTGAPPWRWTLPDGTLLPTQPKALGVALQGRRHAPGHLDEASWDVHQVLAIFDEVMRTLGQGRDALRLDRVHVERDGWHPHRSVVLLVDGVEVGFAGQLHPAEATRRDLPEPVVAGELIVQPWLQSLMAGRRDVQGVELPTHQSMLVDIAIEAPDAVSWPVLRAAVEDAAAGLLADAKVFDVYRGGQVAEGSRSIAARLWLQDPERQLSGQDEARVLESIDRGVADVGARLRR